ncbi:MAG: LD-carboxypeptidase, partial [Bacteroidetes bacterium]|nr:LD-carboxypeptidase [Bacteroidota bacterium]
MILKRTIYILLIALLNQSCSLAQSASHTNFEPIAYKKLIQPPYLHYGDTVAIISPAGILKNKKEKIQQAVDLLKSWGLNTFIGKNTFNQNN